MITEIKGDFFQAPQLDNKVYIVHGCNDAGRCGKGFIVPLYRVYPHAKKEFLSASKAGNMTGGTMQIVDIDRYTSICNAVTQMGVATRHDSKDFVPFKMNWFKKSLETLVDHINNKKEPCVVRMPKVGAGLGRGNWNEIKKMIEGTLKSPYIQAIEVYYI